MVDTPTNNFNFTVLTVGGDSGTWGGIVNTTNTTPLDAILGATQAVTMTSSNVTLTTAQFQNKAFKITGTLTTNLNLILPLTPTGSPDNGAHSVGGHFIVDNETTGAFNITVLTSTGGSTGVAVPQGSRSELYSDGTNVMFADDSRIAKLNSFAGNPNGSVAGSAASVNNPADFLWDRTNGVGYVCTTGGNAAAAVWTAITGQVPAPQGYLTSVSGTPIITGDSIGATTIYYTPYIGDLMPIWTGSTFGLFHFPELALALSASQATNGLYDVFGFIDTAGTGLPQVAFGPSWGSGTGGNQTAGSCARGTGAGGTALQRKNGLLTNAATITAANNGASTFNIPANNGTYLGSIFVDATAGQVTCKRLLAQNGKWGIFNAYNRASVTLSVGDPVANWNYGGATIRPSNNTPSVAWSSNIYNQGSGTTCNGAVVLCGLAEEEVVADFHQSISTAGSSNANGQFGVGFNSTTAFSAMAGRSGVFDCDGTARGLLPEPPFLGIGTFQCLELWTSGANNIFMYGNGKSRMTVSYRA